MAAYALVLFLAGAALNLVIAGYNYGKHRVRVGWLQAPGQIETSNLRNDEKDSYLLEMLQGAASVAEVSYSYAVAGSYYSGRNDVVFRDETEAWSYLDCHRTGDSVCVYYDPENPEHSAIEPGTARVGRYVLAGLCFLLLGVLVLLHRGGKP
jgi:hypothetical protein